MAAQQLDAIDSDYGILEHFSDFNLEDKKERLARLSPTAGSSSGGEDESKQEAFEALRKDLAKSSPASASAASATASATPNTQSVDKNKRALQSIKAELKKIQQTERPISMGSILSYLHLSDEEELAAVAASAPKWKEYFTADPFKPNSLATLTKEGASKLLLKMGYIQE